jgi:hypothetical protein
MGLGISDDTNCLMVSKAISLLERLSIFSKKSLARGVIFSGKYNPLSGAIPLITACLKDVVGACLFSE